MTHQETIAMMAVRLYTLDTSMSFADAVHDAIDMWNEAGKQIAGGRVARCDAEQVPA